MARTNRPDEAYHIPTLNRWFALAGLTLLITSVWMIWADYDRPWKDTQRQFYGLEREALMHAEAARIADMDADTLAEGKAALAAAEATLVEKRSEIATLQGKIEALEQGSYYTAKQAYQFAKAALGDQRYLADKFGKENPGDTAAHAELVKAYECASARVEGGASPAGCEGEPVDKSLWDLFQDKAEELEDTQATYAELLSQKKVAEGNIDVVRKEVIAIEKRLAKSEPGFFNDLFRDAPLVDFLAPSLRIQQVVVTGIRDDYNFASVQKEDRCTTCHLGIDKSEWEVDSKTGRFKAPSIRAVMEAPVVDKLKQYIAEKLPKGHYAAEEVGVFVEDDELSLAAWLDENMDEAAQAEAFMSYAAPELEEARKSQQTFKAHPNLATYMTSASPHPKMQFGCTVCHEGRGHATDFNRVFHTPKNDVQRDKWATDYGWHEAHYWDYPQVPADRLSASCSKCHSKEIKLAGGGEYEEGRRLVERFGCYGCHRIEGITGEVRKAGPALHKVSSKVDENFAYAWIWNPKNFRPTSKMPRFFGQSNNSHPEAHGLNQQEVRGVVAYLFANQDDFDMDDVPKLEGRAERGRKNFQEFGCLGCHSLEEDGFTVNNHGPDLSGIGSKLSKKWMYNWIKDPKRYWAGTHMPSLRLSNQEAVDIVTWLGSMKKKGWETPERPARDVAKQRRLLVDAMGTSMRRGALSTLLDGMNEDDREVMLGEKTIAKYGCTGCHDIKGLEALGPIGTELSTWRDKFVTQLDFGLISYHGKDREVDFNHLSWATGKLSNPRFWDRGKVETKKFAELLRMPNFEFSEHEVHALVTFLLSRHKQEVAHELLPKETPAYVAVQAGRRLVRDYNCHGCHYFDNEGGMLADYWSIDSAGKARFTKPRTRDGDQFDYLEHVPGPVRGHIPPVLLDQGNKTKPPWLFSFVRDPNRLRPQLKMRMPTFGFTDAEANTVIEYFAGLEGRNTGEQTSYAPDPQRAVLGQELFRKGQCTKCHMFTDRDPKTAPPEVVAPNLKLAASRLQPTWTPRWLKDPQSIMPGANMPNYFDFETNMSALDPEGTLIGKGEHHRFGEAMDAINDYLIISGRTYKGAATAAK